MLKRSASFLLLIAATVWGGEESLSQRLVGRWVAVEWPSVEITYRADHTYTARSDSHTLSGTWRVEGDELIEISGTGKFQGTIDKCRFSIRGDRLFFGLHQTISKSHGKHVDQPKQWMTGLTYRRAR